MYCNGESSDKAIPLKSNDSNKLIGASIADANNSLIYERKTNMDI